MTTVKKLLNKGKKALNKVKKYPTKDNLNNVRVFRARARRTIKNRNASHGDPMFPKLITKPLSKKFGI